MKRPHFIPFGPSVEIVPVTDFSRMSLSAQQWADAWRIVGPSAAKNMTGNMKRGPLELWQVIAAAYLEGLHHGSELTSQSSEAEST